MFFSLYGKIQSMSPLRQSSLSGVFYLSLSGSAIHWLYFSTERRTQSGWPMLHAQFSTFDRENWSRWASSAPSS